MRFLATSSSILILITATLFQGGLTSCTKDHTVYDTVTVEHRDTIVIKDTALTAAILTANPWKIQEIRGTIGNSIQYYLRGGSSNTESFDNEYIVFNNNGTGIYVDNAGTHTATTWQFDNSDNTKMTITFYNTPATFDITWENIRYKNKSLFYDEYYTDGNTGLNAHKQTIRIPQ